MNSPKTIRVARCDRCGLCYPEDYFTMWGRTYGRGLGIKPVCEGIASKYHRPATAPVGFPRQSASEVMHPVGRCRGSMTLVDVPVEEELDNRPILAIHDRGMKQRIPIVRARQLEHSASVKAEMARFS